VAPSITPLNLGSSDSPADHWLVIDRRTGAIHAAEVAEARQLVSQPSGRQRCGTISQEEFAILFDRIRQDFESQPMPTAEAVMESLREQHRIVREMVSWLDATPQAQRARDRMRRLAEGDRRREGGR